MVSKLIWESAGGFKVFLVTAEGPSAQHHFSFSSLEGVSLSADEMLSMTAALTTAAFPLQKSLQGRS